MKRTKLRIRAVGDSALDLQKAATVAGQMLFNKKVRLSGFAGRTETWRPGARPGRHGVRVEFVDERQPRDESQELFRVVPNNVAQARLSVGTLPKNNVIKGGDQAMVVDDAEAYAATRPTH